MNVTYDLVAYLGELDEQLNATLDLSDTSLSLEDKARLLFQVEEVTRTLSAFKAEVAGLITDSMEEEVLIVQGLPPLRRSEGSKRKSWQGAKAAMDVTTRVMERLSAEEVPAPADVAEAVRDALVLTGGLNRPSHAWRSEELKKLDLSANSYSAWERGTISVRFDR